MIEKRPRTAAEQFLNFDEAMAEIDRLKFSYNALCDLIYNQKKGSYEAEVAFNSARGFKYRINYVLDSLDRVKLEHAKHIERLTPGAVAAKLGS